MPLFEYQCLSCDRRFEEFVLGASKPRCPACEGRKIRKLLSVFAVSSGSSPRQTEAPASACGSCGDPRGAGACKIN